MKLSFSSLFFLSCCLLFSAPAGAYDDFDNLFNLSLEELMQVKVTGSTLTEKKLDNVPSSISVYTQNEINFIGVDTLDELMNLVPGFQSHRSGGSGSYYPYSVRARRIGGSSSEVLVLVDGQRIDEPRTSGSALIIPKYPLANIERVEFIRGPSSTIYGSNAMLGVINIITRSGVNAINIALGSYNHKQASLQFSQQWHGIGLELFANTVQDDGQPYTVVDTYSPKIITTHDPISQDDVNLKLNWHNTTFNMQHSQFDDRDFYQSGTLSNGFNRRDVEFTSVSIKHNFNWLSVDSYLWLSKHRAKTNIYIQLSPVGAFSAVSTPPGSEPLKIGGEQSFTKESKVQWHNNFFFENASSLQFGVEHRIIDIPDLIAGNNFDFRDILNGTFPIRYYGELKPTTVFQSKSQRKIYGLYGQYQASIFDNTELTLGFRYDNFSDIDSNISSRVGIVHSITNEQSIKLLYAEAFRAPSESELNLQNNPLFLGNPNLKAETVKSWELIWQGHWQKLYLSLGYFENHFSNAINRGSSDNNVLQYLNLDQQPVKGLETELTYHPNNNWQIKASFSHFSEKPSLSFREAEQLASIIVNYQQNNWNINLAAYWRDAAEMATGGNELNNIKLDANWQVFSKVIYQYSEQWHVFLQAKNLLNSEYFTPPESTALSQGISNRGREMSFGLTYSF